MSDFLQAAIVAHWPLVLGVAAPMLLAAWAAFATWRRAQEEKIKNAKLRSAVEEVDDVFTGAVTWGFTTFVKVMKEQGNWGPGAKAEVKNQVREKILATMTPEQMATFAVKCGIPVQEKTAEQLAAALLPFIDNKIAETVDQVKKTVLPMTPPVETLK